MNKFEQQPTLQSKRLLLRPFTLADASEVQRLAGDRAVADTTLNIPHPYEDGDAEEWIGLHPRNFEAGEVVVFAIERAADSQLLGSIGLSLNEDHGSAELGYWIGVPYWNQGYCTEAGHEILRYGFETLGLNRIQARHFSRNAASGRVMQKLGMQHEGRLRQSVKKWGKFEDLELYSILRSEYR